MSARDRIESAASLILGRIVFGATNLPDVLGVALDEARERAARRLAPWLGDAADREEATGDAYTEALANLTEANLARGRLASEIGLAPT